ncbi:hypothetical protein IRJ41_008307, partial [Triplophysa rosa]
MKYRQLKENERRTFSKSKKKSKKTVRISVGIMTKTKNGFRPIRGKNLPLQVEPEWSLEQLLPAAIEKLKDFNRDMEDGEYVLRYPDGSQIKNIPGTDTPFTIRQYKEAIGKAYQRITLFICVLEDFLSKSRECIPADVYLSDCVQLTDSVHLRDSIHNTYTNIYTPVIIDSSSSDLEDEEKPQEKDWYYHISR